MKRSVILASQSPRRIQLLQMMGIEAQVEPSQKEEKAEAETPEELVQALARQKAEDIAGKHPGEEVLVIGMDTVVCLDGEVLGKPKSREDAFRMLQALQGRSHQVYTGAAIIAQGESRSFYEETEVEVAKMSPEEIRAYIETGDPMDKAGSYGIQGIFARHIQGIRGDYYNVMGLPVHRLYEALKAMEECLG